MIADISARVAEIEARFGVRRTQPVPATTPTAGVGGASAAAWAHSVQRSHQHSWLQPRTDLGSAQGASDRYDHLFQAAGARYGVDPALLKAVAWTESNFRPDAVSHAGAQGLMQIMPGTAEGLGVDPMDPAQAVDGAARYLREQLDRFGDTRLALAAYNAGPGAVQRHGGVPPYDETINYVSKVLGRYQSLVTT